MQGPIAFRDIDALIFLHPSVKRWLEGKPDSTIYNNYGRNLLYFTERHSIVPESLNSGKIV